MQSVMKLYYSSTFLISENGQMLLLFQVMKKICDHPALLTRRAANDIAEGMEGYLNTEDIHGAEGMGASSCKIDFLMALLVMPIATSSNASNPTSTFFLLSGH